MTSRPQRESLGGRVVFLTILGLVLLFGGGYAAAYAFAGEKVPRGATVAGIEIGGRTHGAAVAALVKGFAGRGHISATVDGTPVSLEADDLGLSVDYSATVDEAGGGRSWAPDRLWDYYTGGDDIDPVIDVDETRLDAALDRLDRRFAKKPREGAVRFVGTRVETVASRPGTALDRDAARDALVTAYAAGRSADLSLAPAEPAIDDDDVQRALNSFANAAVSGPVALDFGTVRVVLQPDEFTPVLQLQPRGGRLVPDLDEERFARLLDRHIAGGHGAPVDATVRLVDGKPQVVPAKAGVGFDFGEARDAFLDVLRRSDHRRAEIDAEVKRADFTTKDARDLKIVEQVSTFTTYFPYAEYRNQNIGRAAELINGTVLKPGETFSLNNTVGERTRKNGFTVGYVIDDGILVEDLGGGVSQMATTVFNAMFFAGLKDVEHKTHSFYIDRYPVGREATVAWGSVDLRFTNDTPYGVLISAHVTPSTYSSYGVVTVSMYSTKYWHITTRTGERYAFTHPDTRILYGPDCVENDGFDGFQINVWRYFRRPGSDTLVRSEKFHTTYIPSDNVICKPASEDPDR